MASNFIPHLHLNPTANKLGKKWANEIVDYYCRNTDNRSLLDGKKIVDIEGFASGNFDMDEFKKIYKSLRKSLAKESRFKHIASNIENPLGIEFEPLPLLPEKINSATSIVSKIPIEISCVANDPYAIEKKKKDINFIKNKPLVEAQVQEVSDRLGIGEVDLGTTENSSIEFSESPFGLDLNNEDELDIFINLLYSLKIETAFETVLQAYYEIKNAKQVKLLEIKDQFKYGVSANEAFENKLTGLPDINYVYPGDIFAPYSELPDYSDNTHRIRNKRLTPLELFDLFGDEINGMEDLEEIVNGRDVGYCSCNDRANVPKNNWGTFKMEFELVEVKSIDSIGIAKSKHKKGYTTLTEDADNTDYRIWAQNTYRFWSLKNTKYVFGIERLGFSHRTSGMESYQGFSTNIYKSQEKSAVELSIGENKKAQIADIKLQHAVIKSLPRGRYINLKALRGALGGLTDENDTTTMQSLLNLAFEDNIVLGDTEGWEGKNDGQVEIVKDLPGGLGAEVVGYMNIIASANANISRITGINQQLTGQSANPEGLIGMQKLLINSSINSLYYCNEAIGEQYQKVFSLWANIIKQAVENGGKPRDAIVSLIGSKKANVIDGLDDIRLHDIGVFIKVSQREEERQFFMQKLTELVVKGALTAADQFMVLNIQNPKDQYAFLAVKEQKFKKEQAMERQQQFQYQQQLQQQAGQTQLAVKNADTEGRIKEIYARGDVQSKIIQLASELGVNAQKLDAFIKKDLQTERNRSQASKNIEILREKSNLEQQAPLL